MQRGRRHHPQPCVHGGRKRTPAVKGLREPRSRTWSGLRGGSGEFVYWLLPAARWPHLATGELASLLTAHPQLVVHAGGAALR
ncbi:hypothetical protein [Streptomyces olivochromogenes]|uniref:hypothetical protein n=1 Tax=Streptomyces olivochromogenes TaxID=1963 RepID=UPI0036AC186C